MSGVIVKRLKGSKRGERMGRLMGAWRGEALTALMLPGAMKEPGGREK